MSTNIRIIGNETNDKDIDISVFVKTLCKCLDYLATEAEEQGISQIASRLRQESTVIHGLVVKEGR